MAIQYNWQVEWMNSTPNSANPPECVVNVGWRCTATDEEHSASVYGSVGLGEPGTPFVAYADLTKEQVLAWCHENGVDKEATETGLASQIDTLANPPVVQKALPWAAAPVAE